MKKILFLFFIVFSVFLIGTTIMAAEPPPGTEAALLSANATAPIALDTANFMNVTIEIQAAAEKKDSAPAPAQTTSVSIYYVENDISASPLTHHWFAIKRTSARIADLLATL